MDRPGLHVASTESSKELRIAAAGASVPDNPAPATLLGRGHSLVSLSDTAYAYQRLPHVSRFYPNFDDKPPFSVSWAGTRTASRSPTGPSRLRGRPLAHTYPEGTD